MRWRVLFPRLLLLVALLIFVNCHALNTRRSGESTNLGGEDNQWDEEEEDSARVNGSIDNEPPILPPRKEWTEELMSAVKLEEIQVSSSPDTSSDHKLRFNYAAEQCGAKIVETSATVIKGADNILSRSLDSYMLSHCAANNWIVIELCEEIVIDSIVLGNKEFFSSNFKDFTVCGNKRFVPSSIAL